MQDPAVSIAMTEKSGIPICNTSPVVRELLETQERCFKATMQMLIDSIREVVKDIRKFVVKKEIHTKLRLILKAWLLRGCTGFKMQRSLPPSCQWYKGQKST